MTKLSLRIELISILRKVWLYSLQENRTSLLSTDTGIVLRAIELDADAILLAKAIDGIYDSDPKLNPEAKKYDKISITDVVDKHLGVIDMTASVMCMENKMPLMVFGLEEENSIVNALSGKFNGTIVTVE